MSVQVVESETCRESWRVASDNSAGNSMRSTPAQSTAPSAVQLHSAGHSVSTDLVGAASVSSSSSSASRGAWQWTNTQTKSSTPRACMMECLGKAMSTLNRCCCTSTQTGRLAATSAQQSPVSCKHHLIKALTYGPAGELGTSISVSNGDSFTLIWDYCSLLVTRSPFKWNDSFKYNVDILNPYPKTEAIYYIIINT